MIVWYSCNAQWLCFVKFHFCFKLIIYGPKVTIEELSWSLVFVYFFYIYISFFLYNFTVSPVYMATRIRRTQLWSFPDTGNYCLAMAFLNEAGIEPTARWGHNDKFPIVLAEALAWLFSRSCLLILWNLWSVQSFSSLTRSLFFSFVLKSLFLFADSWYVSL